MNPMPLPDTPRVSSQNQHNGLSFFPKIYVIVADISRLRDEVGSAQNDSFEVAMCRVVDWWRGKLADSHKL